MKTTGACPKYGASKILRIPGRVGPYGRGNNIPVGLTIFSSAKVTRYLCEACGFSEEWVGSPSDIQKLHEKYGT